MTQQRQEDVAEDEQAGAEERNSPRDPRSSRTRKWATLTAGRALQWLCSQLLAPACSMQDESMCLTSTVRQGRALKWCPWRRAVDSAQHAGVDAALQALSQSHAGCRVISRGSML